LATRLTLLCASATASSRVGGFPSPDEPLDAGGARKAAALRLRGPMPAVVVSSPTQAAIETARILGHDALVEPLLGDLAYGDWSGRSLAAVGHADEALLAAWLADPTQPTPGGERPDALVARVASWMDRQAEDAPTMLAICHAAVMRAAVSHALAMPLGAAMRIDIAPLTAMILSHHGQWRLQEIRRNG
jgi:broad specificity phosphatase PhoE